MPAIRAWLEANPEQAPALMHENRSYVFFRWLDGAKRRRVRSARRAWC